MNYSIMYIELKSGFQDNGPAWIGKVAFSKSRQTIYFMNKAFKKGTLEHGVYFDAETGDKYWISGVKKNGQDRHWVGSGKIIIDSKIIGEYLRLTGQKRLDMTRFKQEDISEEYPVDRINELENIHSSMEHAGEKRQV